MINIDTISETARVFLNSLCNDDVGFALVLVELDNDRIAKSIHIMSNGDGPEETARMLYRGADEVALKVKTEGE